MSQLEPLPPQPMPPAGWHPDGTGVLRYWDGFRWTERTAPMPQPVPQPIVQYAPVVQPAQQPYIPDATNHVLHLLLTLVTCGLWAPVWLLIGWSNSRGRNDAIRRAQGLQP